MSSENVSSLYRLSLLYAAYRLFVSLILFLIFILDLVVFKSEVVNPALYLSLVTAYFMGCVGQFISYSFFPFKTQQLMGFGIIDVLVFALINFIIGQANIYIGLMYVVTVFVINLVYQKRVALFLTLASIISVVYLPFIDGWMNVDRGDAMVNSLILSTMFIVVFLIGGYAVKRFQQLEQINSDQTERLSQFRKISNKFMELIDTGYVVADAQYELLLINPAARQMLGVREGDNLNLGQELPDLCANLQSRIIFRPEQVSFEYRVEGQQLFISYRLLDLKRGVFLLTVEDMGNIAQRLQSLKLATLGKLTASIAHEIRNPLTAIQQSNNLITGMCQGNDDIAEYTTVISRQTGRINKIVESTLSLAKYRDFTPAAIHLPEVIESLFMEDLADVQDQINIAHVPHVCIYFDEDHLRQVLVNLVRNAVRHNDFNVSTHVVIRFHVEKEFIEIDVIDFGSGVRSDMVNSLFEPFITTEVNGTGLGLHLSKNLCEVNKADLKYVADEGGVCFRLSCRKCLEL